MRRPRIDRQAQAITIIRNSLPWGIYLRSDYAGTIYQRLKAAGFIKKRISDLHRQPFTTDLNVVAKTSGQVNLPTVHNVGNYTD
jgi:hypothetical protein